MVPRDRIERTARRAARRGGKILADFYETGLRPRYKGEINLVTEADLASQKAVVETIRKSFPDHRILAEEDEETHGRAPDGPTWIVDPLDGTNNFAHGYPMFAVSIAFFDRGELHFGLVYNPLTREEYRAHRGKGAWLGSRRIRVSRERKLDRSLLGTGFPYDRRESDENNVNHFCHFEFAALCCRRGGAASLDLAFVAAGRLDGFWEPKLAPWDVAAGIVLVQEAGGRVTTFDGGKLGDLWCGEIVASNTHIHAQILDGLERSRNVIVRPGPKTIRCVARR